MTSPTDPKHHRQPDIPAVGHVAHGRAVVGFDATAASQNALAYAIGWGHRVGGQLDLLHVRHDDWQWAVDIGAATCTAVIMPNRDSDLSGAAADLLAETQLAWTYHTAHGDIARALEQHAEHISADIIIIGRSTHQGHRPLRTTTAHRLINLSKRIIVVVP